MTDLTLRGRIIDLNNFNTDILANYIEEPGLVLKTQQMKGGGEIKPKEFSHEKWTRW